MRISADEAFNLRRDHVRNVGGADQLMKVAKSAPPSWNSGTRSARFVMTSQSVDRYGDVVVTNGLDTTQFEKNPQAFLNHNSADWPIGSWDNVEKILRGRPPRMEGDLTLAPSGGPIPQIDQAAWAIQNGIMQACSIGFIPNWDAIEKVVDDGGSWTGGLQFNEAEIVECSLCGVPANPEALAKSLKGNIGLARETIESVLDTWERNAEGLLVPRAAFEEAHRRLSPHAKSLAGKATLHRALPAYDPDGDGDNDAEETLGFVNSAMALLEEASDCLTGQPDSDDATDKSLRRVTLGKALPAYDPDGDGDNDAEEALGFVNSAMALLEEASDCLTGQPDSDDANDKSLRRLKSMQWVCSAARDLAIGDGDAWDGGAAAGHLLDAANIGGDNPDYAQAAKGFLVHDGGSPDLRGSYKLPFADMVDGKMTAMPGGLRAAASRLPQTDIPQNCMDEARAVLDGYFARMGKAVKGQLARRLAADVDLVTMPRSRAEALERGEKNRRLAEKRGRELDLIRARAGR